MTATKPAMQMSELLVFARPLVIGFVGAEVWRVAFCLGANFATTWSSALWVKAGGIVIGALLCLIYAFKRGAHLTAARMGRSVRLDLLLAIGIGIWVLLRTRASLASRFMDGEHAFRSRRRCFCEIRSMIALVWRFNPKRTYALTGAISGTL
jgi:hypothetical protein